MALGNPQCFVTYTGNGTTSAYDAPFPVQENTHLVVTGARADGTPFEFRLGVDYFVSLHHNADNNPISASITLATALPGGWTMDVARIVPLTQSADFTNQSGMSPETVEAALDYLMMAVQQTDYKTFSGNAQMQYIVSLIPALQAKDAQLSARIDEVAAAVDDKAGVAALNSVRTQMLALVDKLTGEKADAAAVAEQYALLQGQISNLVLGKADKTDPRFADARTPTEHASSHARYGGDHLTPESIGALGDGHVSEGNPHPQYMLQNDWIANEFFQFDPEMGSLRLREMVEDNAESPYLVQTATGIALGDMA